MTEQNSKIKSSILGRVSFLYLAFFVVCVAIFIKIIWIQLGTESKQLKTRSIQYSYRSEVISAPRGNILSSDGRILSTTIPLYELRMDMAARGLIDSIFENSVEGLALELSKFFADKTPAQYTAELRKARKEEKGYYRVTKRKVNYLELQRVKQFPLFRLGPNKGGFLPVEIGMRMRPHGELASRVIGFTNSTGIKVGLEGGFDNRLRGIDGNTIKQKISGSFWIPISSPLNIEAQPGLDVVTTLDIELQDIAQSCLRERIAEVNAQWGTVIVMEVETGHIKAMANATRNPSTGLITEDYNYALGMSMEPGSTFKIAGLLALLDDAGMKLTDMVNTEGGTVFIGSAKVVDTRRGGYGTISLQEVFEHSSNIGMAKSVNKYYAANPSRFVDYLAKLQFDKPIGLQLAGEARPVLRRPAERGWDGTTLTMMAYGYALRITPMHTITLCNAIANNGRMIKPLFVKELLRNGEVVQEFPTVELSPQIASPRAIADTRKAMEGVITAGTAKSLKNPNYSVAAKTGTAQVAMGRGGYYANGGRTYLGSVVGYFPADKPKYSIMIAIQTFHRDGSSDPYYGGALASPLFRTIADRIYTTKYDFLTPLKRSSKVLPEGMSIKKGDPEKARLTLSAMRIISTDGLLERGMAKSAHIQADKGDSTATVSINTQILGYDLSSAVRELEKQGYSVKAYGRGRVAQVSIDTTATHGQKAVMLTLRP